MVLRWHFTAVLRFSCAGIYGSRHEVRRTHQATIWSQGVDRIQTYITAAFACCLSAGPQSLATVGG